MSSDHPSATVCMPVEQLADGDAVMNIDTKNNDGGGDDVDIVNATAAEPTIVPGVNRKRLCRFPGCERVIKSQGHCQRHGARAKRCRYVGSNGSGGCDKQAQGTYDGMCKRHWRIIQNQNKPIDEIIPPNSNKIRLSAPPPPSGVSVYEWIIPNSIAYRPSTQQMFSILATTPNHAGGGKLLETTPKTVAINATDHPEATTEMLLPDMTDTTVAPTEAAAHTTVIEPIVPPKYDPHHNATTMSKGSSTAAAAATTTATAHNSVPTGGYMPLVQYFADNVHLPIGWHRIHERRTRGVYPIASVTTQLEGWERQLAFLEICLLSGGTPQANFKHFCHAWGRDATFISRLANFICERRGEFDRKKPTRSSDGTAIIDKKHLKKTGVIIPRTTPLEMYRNSIADAGTMLDIAEELPLETRNDLDIEPTNTNNSHDNDGINNMIGNDNDDPFLMDNDSTEETTVNAGQKEITEV